MINIKINPMIIGCLHVNFNRMSYITIATSSRIYNTYLELYLILRLLYLNSKYLIITILITCNTISTPYFDININVKMSLKRERVNGSSLIQCCIPTALLNWTFTLFRDVSSVVMITYSVWSVCTWQQWSPIANDKKQIIWGRVLQRLADGCEFPTGWLAGFSHHIMLDAAGYVK